MKKHISMIFLVLLTVNIHSQETPQNQPLEEPTPGARIQFVDFMFTDLSGSFKSVTYPFWLVDRAMQDGICFDGSSVPGCTSIKDSDMLLKPDINTARDIPWTQNPDRSACVICDIGRNETTPYEGDPRYILKKELARAHAMGYTFVVGPELEFFLFKKDEHGKQIPSDNRNYFTPETNVGVARFKKHMLRALSEQNIKIEKLHHEVAHGQLEVSIRYGDALELADQVMLAKHTIASLAPLGGFEATFMPKPVFGQNGSAMHVHFSLYDHVNNRNAFYDPQNPYKLSDIAQHFIAGILKHAEEITAILNPTVNSFKRLVPGYEAPIFVCWGTKNRSALIRIPHINEGNGNAVRAEIRSPDPMSNPYLVFAALLHAGLEGIQNKEPLPNAVEHSLYEYTSEQLDKEHIRSLPTSLSQALDILKNSSFIKELLGEKALEEFVHLKTKELRSFNTTITDWELNHYFRP
ncbi:MAG TPA: glutamine synthetase family protein [Candidatus Dependentiae bacterium]|nr:glutamine synthetase family protein [Candidatus Dependentiae bacterium]HRQ63009.1 glutamine synthetase family protein [Candidatus Dependentiae bacterium]